jgi:general stress protein 26
MFTEKEMKKVRTIVDDLKVCMLTTEDGESLRSRPMYTTEMDEAGNLWFFTNEYSEKVKETRLDHHVNLAYSCPKANTYISISATAQLIDNQEKIEELWSPAVKAWFPDGKESEHLALLKVTPESAEYWDTSSSKLVSLFRMGKALATGEVYEGGEHAKVMM